MILKNDNKSLSGNRRKRIERKSKMDGNMKSLLNKIETGKKKKNENFDKSKELEIELGKIKNANNPKSLQSELKELNKTQVVTIHLHKIKQEILIGYTSEFETVGRLRIADQTRETQIRFRNVNDYEAYTNAIDQDYESEDTIFNGYIYKIDTTQFILVTRS